MAQNISRKNVACHEQEFVISACGFTFQGYRLLLEEQGIKASHLQFNDDEIPPRDVEEILSNQHVKVSVFLGKDIVNLLESIKRLASVLNALPVLSQVTLYGQIPDSWLHRTLTSLVDNKLKLSMIRIATISDVAECLKKNSVVFKDCSRLLREESLNYAYKDNCKGLTKRELNVLLNFYRGMSVKDQCEKLGLSDKTVYTHRKQGIEKLDFIRLSVSEPNAFKLESIVGRKKENTLLSSRDIEISNALLKREIFPAYQVITDRYKKVVGFEILLRWNNNGKIVKPASFLSEISNVEVWLKITALVIHAAVVGINKYNGKYYFSVNIPPQLASGNALPGMAKKAIEMLLKPEWCEKLVFEFAETIDVMKDKTIPETMQRLRNTGCRLFLDDCFSNHHTLFPVRQVHFDGLKLDRDIVAQFVANDNDYNLIKAIQFYSEITGSDCIAEGVDSEEKFDKLVALGVKSFQGYYLSRAVKEEELDRTVRLFS